MKNMAEGMYIGFFWKITGKRERRTATRTWETLADREMLQASRIKTEDNYIGHRKGMVAQWVVIILIFDVCAQEWGFGGGVKRRITWWRQEALYEFLWEILVEALREEWMRQ